MKIFLTGGTGFIGSHVLKKLMSSPIEVIAHRRGEDSHPKISIDQPINWLTKAVPQIEVTDFDGVDVLLHLASHSVQYPFDTLANNIHYNVVEPLEMFEKACQAGVKNYVVAGSCFEYGLSGERYEFIPPDAPLEPTNDYATSKAMFYLATRQLVKSYRVGISYNRLFHVFGPGESKERFWPSLRRAAISGQDFDMTPGEQVRAFTPVGEMAELLIEKCHWIHRTTGVSFSVSNLGSNSVMSLREFAESWWEHYEASGNLIFGKVPYRPNEVMRYVPLYEQDLSKQ